MTDSDQNSDNRKNPLESLGLPSPLILGSGSFTRKLIIKQMGIPFDVVVCPIDEKKIGDRSKDLPPELVLAVAKAKADAVLEYLSLKQQEKKDCDTRYDNRVILTGDQVVTCDDEILEKPESIEEAKHFCSKYATHPPSTTGSIVLTHIPTGIQVSGVDKATVHFRNDSSFDANELVDQLVHSENAPILSCAGGLMVEHPLVQHHIQRIDGTQDSVMGLSKNLLLQLLEQLSRKVVS